MGGMIDQCGETYLLHPLEMINQSNETSTHPFLGISDRYPPLPPWVSFATHLKMTDQPTEKPAQPYPLGSDQPSETPCHPTKAPYTIYGKSTGYNMVTNSSGLLNRLLNLFISMI